MSIELVVLGSAAGGGFPQWNCLCRNCRALRAGDTRYQARSQSSIAVSGNGRDWLLINASPDIREQLARCPELHPPISGVRGTPIRGVLLMDSQIDHSAGLLSLREGDPLRLYTTRMAYEDLNHGFPVIPMLQHYCGVEWTEIGLDQSEFGIPGIDDLGFTAVPLTSKAPPYSPHREAPHPGDNIGLRIRDLRTGRSVFYAPGIGHVDDALRRWMAEADCLLVEGTFWSEKEMADTGAGHKSAADMGHLALVGRSGLLRVLDALEGPRKLLIHINNTNPILDESSPEREQLARHGVEVTHDGMRLEI
jgi:pyrroloquinoline quinone biosynthesis protein B